MTRGTGYLVTENSISYHDEFNGDMYPDGYGLSFIKMISKTTPKNFNATVKRWNKNNHDYSDFKTHSMPLSKFKPFSAWKHALSLDFNVKYFDWFFSDWVFIKNASQLPIKVKTNKSTGFNMEILPGETRAFSFGQEDGNYTPDTKLEDL
jgi:hypothetical protein